MILVLGACPDIDLEVCRLFRCQLAEVGNLMIFGKFDQELTILIPGSDSDSESWSMSKISIRTCVQNLISIGLDLIGFGVECRSLKF